MTPAGHFPLQEIIEAAGPLASSFPGLADKKVIDHPDLGLLKIRIYPTEQEAGAIQAILARLKGKVAFPELLGRQQRYLIFRFLEIENLDDAQPDPETYTQIGRFLAILNREVEAQAGLQSLNREFYAWLKTLSASRLLPRAAVTRAWRHYQDNQPSDLPICLDYWDAMPHNFGLLDGDLVLLDEKHLRPSFAGVGLVKPRLVLPAEAWAQIQSGYREISSLEFYESHADFLEFYYLVVALGFYARIATAGKIELLKNPRFLDYRERLIQIVSARSTSGRVLGEIHLVLSFPEQALFLLRRRFSLFKARLSGRGKEWRS